MTAFDMVFLDVNGTLLPAGLKNSISKGRMEA